MRKKLKKELVEKMSTLVTAAFGLVAALAWNDAIKAVFNRVFEKPDHVLAMLSYAVFVTILAVLITLWVGKTAEKLK
ncbi:MAG: DUF5654 family protein [Candidatus Undinarchaeales archaeon]